MTRLGSKKGNEKGFTLLEVMVALFILGMVAGAMSRSAGQATRNIQQLELHQHAVWVANNQLALILLGSESQHDGEKSFAGYNFYWKAAISSTPLERFSKVTVKVSAKGNRDYLLAELVGFKQ